MSLADRSRLRRSLAWLCVCALAACSAAHPQPPGAAPSLDSGADGISHRVGSNAAVARVHYGVPILQRSLLWDGNGEDDDYGPGLYGYRFVNDGLALGMGINTVVWKEDAHDVYSAEWEALLRWYPRPQGHFFWDVTYGYVHGTDAVPTGGTEWNYTFGFGPGVDIPVGHETSVLIGTTYHHTSNALGRDNPRNPSQNEMRFWVGFAWNF